MDIDALRIECTDQLCTLEASWKSLEQLGYSLPYQGFDWITQVSRLDSSPTHYFVSLKLADSNDTVAILPFALHERMGVRILRWLGDKHCNHQGGIYSFAFLDALTPENFKKLWKRISAALPAYDVAWLDAQAETWDGRVSPFSHLGGKIQSANSYSQLVFPHHDWKTLAPTLRSKKARKRMRNEENRLSREADISWKTVNSIEEIDLYLPLLFQQREDRLNELGISAEDNQHAYLMLYRSLLVQSINDSNERMHMMVLKADDEMIAGLINFEWKSVLYPLLISMTGSRYRQWSPGEYLLRLLFQKACDQQIKMVDIGPGDQDYKSSWCNHEIGQFENVKGHTLKGYLAAIVIRSAIFAKRTIKNNPKLWDLFTRLRKLRAKKDSGISHAKRIQELG